MPERLTQCLVDRGVLSPEAAEEALERQVLMGGALDTALLELGLVEEPELLGAFAEVFGLEVARPEDATAAVDERALRALPEQWARRHQIAPLSLDSGLLSVLTPAPADVQLVVRLGEMLELTLRPVLAPEFRVAERLALLYGTEPDERHRALIAAAGGRVGAPPSLESGLDFGAAVARLAEPQSRDEVGRTALGYVGRHVELSLLLVVQDGLLDGWMGRGPGADRLAGVSVAVHADSAFRVVLDTRAHYLGPLADDPSHRQLLAELGRVRPRAALIAPIRVRDRTVALLYADNGPREFPPRAASNILLFLTHVQGALLTLLNRRKAASLSQLPASDSVELPVPWALSEPPPPVGRGDTVEMPVSVLEAAMAAAAHGEGILPSHPPQPANPEPDGFDEAFEEALASIDPSELGPEDEPFELLDAMESSGAASDTDGSMPWEPVDLSSPGLIEVANAEPEALSFPEPAQPEGPVATDPEVEPGADPAGFVARQEDARIAEPEASDQEAGDAGYPPPGEQPVQLDFDEPVSGDLPEPDPSDWDGEDEPGSWEPVETSAWDEVAADPDPGPTDLGPPAADVGAGPSESDPGARSPAPADLGTEAWLRAANRVEAPRALPPDVLERAAMEPSGRAPLDAAATVVQRALPTTAAESTEVANESTEVPAVANRIGAVAIESRSFAPGSSALAEEVRSRLEQLAHPMKRVRGMAREALAAMGPAALPLMAERFPGPLVVNPFAPEVVLPPFAECGPLLSLLDHHGRESHPFVLARLDAPDPLVRFFAAYFYSAVYVPEAVPRLIQRLHDEEARICMATARTLFGYRSHSAFGQVLSHLHGRLEASSVAARRHAVHFLGLFRDVSAIPVLIDVLDRKDRTLLDVAESALAEITKQQLGTSARRWRAWWAKNGDKSRIEWLIDGLAGKEEAIRRSAVEELRALTGEDFGFVPAGPRRARDQAVAKWRSWWAEQPHPA